MSGVASFLIIFAPFFQYFGSFFQCIAPFFQTAIFDKTHHYSTCFCDKQKKLK